MHFLWQFPVLSLVGSQVPAWHLVRSQAPGAGARGGSQTSGALSSSLPAPCIFLSRPEAGQTSTHMLDELSGCWSEQWPRWHRLGSQAPRELPGMRPVRAFGGLARGRPYPCPSGRHTEVLLVSPALPGQRRRPRLGSLSHHLPLVPQDAFHAFHIDLDFVGKFLKPLLVGELAPEEPSQDRGKNVSQTGPRKGGEGLWGERVPALRLRVAPRATVHHPGSGRTQNRCREAPSCCQPGPAPRLE